MVRVVPEFLDTVAASVRGIFGGIFCHGGQENLVVLNECFYFDFFVRTSGWNSPRRLGAVVARRAHNLLMKVNDIAVIPDLSDGYKLYSFQSVSVKHKRLLVSFH